LKLQLIAVGKRMPAWVEAGYQEYAKRLPPEFRLELTEITLSPRQKNADMARAIQMEGEAMLAAVPAGATVVALEVVGVSWSTEKLAQQLEKWRETGAPVCLLVGGPDGLAATCVARAQQKWSLSALTLPHPLVRIVVAEQLYRAFTILSGHPYHRG
jgi:23S rRNA (pseudouridine1915-N3)-methyltransferase